ncbi:MAG: exodeoxyribonuclease VII small subunit [Bacteroidaceae bacterium]|nr:exodeoxyribonuclease VII small subunit [Bacteroidaceae bacterium]
MPTIDTPQTYEAAMQRLEHIAATMERGEMPIDQMAEQLKQAQALIAFCKNKLLAADEEIQKIIADMK